MRTGKMGFKTKEGSLGIDEFFVDMLDFDALFKQHEAIDN